MSEDRGAALPATTSRRGLVVGLVLGVPLLVYGIRGALVDAVDTHPGELALWLVGAGLVHDLVVAPLVLALGFVAARVVRDERAGRALRAGFVVSAGLALVAWPFVRGYGRTAAVPSVLPRNYALGLAAYLTVTWAVVGAVVFVGVRRRGRCTSPR